MTLEQALYPTDFIAPLGIDVRGDEAPNPNQDGSARRQPMTPDELERYRVHVAEFAKQWEIAK